MSVLSRARRTPAPTRLLPAFSPATVTTRPRGWRGAVLAAVLGLALATSTLVGAAPASAASRASVASAQEARMVAVINATRAAHGLRPLHPVAGMMSYARRHARAMASRGSLFHTSNFSVICCWRQVAENVGMGGSVPGLHRAFLASPGHRANLLNGSLSQVGIGLVSSGGRLWVTEVFRRPR
jgi:uncharacterized protein YkwD